MKISITVGALLLSVVCWAQVPTMEHVFIVVEENQDFSCVIGNPAMSYLNELATKYGVATSYYATRHPSISNYFVLTTGQDFYQHSWDDLRTDPVDVDNVVRKLRRNGKSWRAYVEGVPKSGYMGGDIKGTFYVKRHNPLAYFEKDIPLEERVNLAPFSQFVEDLKEGGKHLANYSFLVPNLLDDAHDAMGNDGDKLRTATCGDSSALEGADDWLANNVRPLVESDVFKRTGLLVIVFDESSDDDESNGAGHKGGGRVPMVLVGSRVKPGYRSIVLYHHQSTLRLMLEALGLNSNYWPGASKTAPSMAEFFTSIH